MNNDAAFIIIIIIPEMFAQTAEIKANTRSQN